MIPSAMFGKRKMDCTGFALISAARIKDVCSETVAYIQSMQERKTKDWIEARRQRENKRRKFWSKVGFAYRETTTDEVRADLDNILHHGSLSEMISIMSHYPLDTTSDTWKEKAQKLLKLAEDAMKVYVNADDWEVLLRFEKKQCHSREKEHNQ